ncbi:helix-turn-helix domain-containing protein [Streptomyces sp. NPDC085466]|uniref:GbsR/MarR family transcriptional regulator n=1 Tax=Streptomyces sp. NPDC085466 TaxID=3365725 RepID=UPI0037D6D4AB
MPGGRLTQQERRHIAAGLAHGLSYAEIARRLDRPTSTISREIARNGGAHAYRPDRAHRATADRAHRAAPAPVRAAGSPREATGDELVEVVEIAVRSGMPRMTARVHVDLLLSEDGRRTAAELARRLEVSPASVSVAVNFLLQQGYVRRERDPHRRRDVYVVDDDAWYHSIVVSVRQTLASAQAAIDAAEALGPDNPAARRLTKAGVFLERVVHDLKDSADHWRPLLS